MKVKRGIAFWALLLTVFVAPQLRADITFEYKLTERYTLWRNSKGAEGELRSKIFVKDYMSREELSYEGEDVPSSIYILDARKQTIVVIIPRYRAYAVRQWSEDASSVTKVLLHGNGPDITETNQNKSMGQWNAKSRTVMDPACGAQREEWVTDEPEILRDVMAFEQAVIAAKARNASNGSVTGRDIDANRVFLLTSKEICGKDAPTKSLRGSIIERETTNIHLDAVDPNLFVPPPDFEEFSYENLAKAAKKNKAPKK